MWRHGPEGDERGYMDQREIRKKMAPSETHNNTLGGHERAAYS